MDPGRLRCLGWPKPGKGRALRPGALKRGALEPRSPDSWYSALGGRNCKNTPKKRVQPNKGSTRGLQEGLGLNPITFWPREIKRIKA